MRTDEELCVAAMDNGDESASDMTKREKIAAAAMHAILSGRTGFLVDCGTDNAATYAVRCADKLLRQLEEDHDFMRDELRKDKTE